MAVKFKGLWTRWHRYDSAGNKQIKKFYHDNPPSPLCEEGYTQWVRGTGKLTEQHYNNVVNAVRKACVGVPKTEEQKEKMRQAKLGKPKTEEHKKNMSLSWQKKRQEKYKEAMQQLDQMRQA